MFEIDCHECGGSGTIAWSGLGESKGVSKCLHCVNGKIQVYTESEMESKMKDSYFESGTIGTTPLYTKTTAKRKNLGKLYTQAEMDVWRERNDKQECCIIDFKADIQVLRDIISELIDIYEDIRTEDIDSFSLQPAREVVGR